MKKFKFFNPFSTSYTLLTYSTFDVKCCKRCFRVIKTMSILSQISVEEEVVRFMYYKGLDQTEVVLVKKRSVDYTL